jgi:hypothetical protein
MGSPSSKVWSPSSKNLVAVHKDLVADSQSLPFGPMPETVTINKSFQRPETLNCYVVFRLFLIYQMGQDGVEQEKRNLLDALPGKALEQIHKGRTTPVFLCGQA